MSHQQVSNFYHFAPSKDQIFHKDGKVFTDRVIPVLYIKINILENAFKCVRREINVNDCTIDGISDFSVDGISDFRIGDVIA